MVSPDRRVDHKQAHRESDDLSATTDSLRLFMNAIAQYPLLTAREEVELAKRVERGDRAAKERMINSNLRLVVSIASRYQGEARPLLDLIQDGALGLIRAVEKYDWRRGHRFSTYATWWIRQAVQRGMANKARTIRLPVHIAERERRLARAQDRLSAQLGRSPSDEELAREVGLRPEQVTGVREAARAVTSLDKPLGDEEGATMGELLPAQGADLAFEKVSADSLRTTVRAAVRTLPELEQKVIELRYLAVPPCSLEVAARQLGLPRHRARQVENRALEQLSQRRELQAFREAA